MNDRQSRELERREERRRRRVRNQIIAYTVVGVFLAGIAAGGVFAGKSVWDKHQEKKKQQEMTESTEEQMKDSEEDIVLTEPEPEPIVDEVPIEDKINEVVNAAIEVMSLEDKVAGLFIVTPESITGVSTAIKAGDGTKAALEKLTKLERQSEQVEEGEALARYFHDTVIPAMAQLREPVDKLEMMVDKEMWPMPSYGDLMFEV